MLEMIGPDGEYLTLILNKRNFDIFVLKFNVLALAKTCYRKLVIFNTQGSRLMLTSCVGLVYFVCGYTSTSVTDRLLSHAIFLKPFIRGI